MKLINKGRFRERANRSSSYKKSENHVADLKPHQYPQKQPEQIPKTPTK